MKKAREGLILLTSMIYSGAAGILKKKEGQTLVEYALLLMLIAVVVIAAVAVIGQKACNSYSNIASQLPNS